MKKKTFRDWGIRFVCHFARNNVSNNMFALIVLPAILIGACWGYGYPALLHALSFQTIHTLMVATKLAKLGWLLAAIPPAVITYFMIHPLCRGIQALLPDTFTVDIFDDRQES